MTIPKASFLHQSYKSKHTVEALARVEAKILLSIIRGSLRNPHTCKLGTMTYFFSREKFPNLCDEKSTALVQSIVNKFLLAGYNANLTYENSGFSICLDWTEEPPRAQIESFAVILKHLQPRQPSNASRISGREKGKKIFLIK